MTWDVKTELINPDTQLRKVNATHIESSRTFFVKTRMKTEEEKKAVWDNIWNQYKDSMKVVSDSVAVEGVDNLKAREL